MIRRNLFQRLNNINKNSYFPCNHIRSNLRGLISWSRSIMTNTQSKMNDPSGLVFRAFASKSSVIKSSFVLYSLYKPTSLYSFCDSETKTIPAMKAVQRVTPTSTDAIEVPEFSSWRLMYRLGELLWLFAPCIITLPLLYFDTFKDWHNWWFKKLRTSMEIAGPAFIKWGQWASTRYDLFPNEMTKQLAYLTNSAPVHSYAHTKYLVEESFNCPIEEIFTDFEMDPIASGSIAQVHKAKLKPKYKPKSGSGSGVDGDDGIVAVKVQHPNVLQSIELDFALFKVFVK